MIIVLLSRQYKIRCKQCFPLVVQLAAILIIGGEITLTLTYRKTNLPEVLNVSMNFEFNQTILEDQSKQITAETAAAETTEMTHNLDENTPSGLIDRGVKTN